jgi:NhaP-type Na+/H+ or K+/H+ antiporter
VLYQLFVSLRKVPNLRFNAIYGLLATAKLFYVSIGGIFMGLLFGFIASFSTRFTSATPLLEPLLVLLFAFASYFASESILMSGIVSILFCGAFMNRYVELNISKKSHTTLKYGLKLIASTAETLVFIYLGMSLVLHHHIFDWAFSLVTIIVILLFRFLCIFGITILYNLIAKRQGKAIVSMSEQFILSYSGLRGIVFALAFIIPDDPAFKSQKDALITSTMIASCFTIFVQGSTIRPIMKYLSIKSEKKTKKQVSQELAAEKFSLHMEEREITKTLKHAVYLESTLKDLPLDNPERKEFQEVNTLVEEKILQRVLGEVEQLSLQIIQFNNDYINTETMTDLLMKKYDVFNSIQESWRCHIEELGVEKIPDASSDILSTFSTIRKYMYPDEIHSSDDDIESRASSDASADLDQSFLHKLLVEKGVVYSDTISGTYQVADWANNEDVLYYLRRILQEENMEYWITEAYFVIDSLNMAGVIPLLKALRFEVQRQQENRSAEIGHLKRIDFASKVLSLGIKHTVEAVEALTGPTTTTRVVGYPKYWAKKIDTLIQKICVRSLHAEESSLVRALQSLRKFELSLDCMEVGNTTDEDEFTLLQDLQEQEHALRVIQEVSNNPKVNFQRIWHESDESKEDIAGKELTILLELDDEVIDESQYEQKLKLPELVSLNVIHDYSKIRHIEGDDDMNDQISKKLRESSRRYEIQLAEIESEVIPVVETEIMGVGSTGGGTRRKSVVVAPTTARRFSVLPSMSRRLSVVSALSQRRNTMVLPNSNEYIVPSLSAQQIPQIAQEPSDPGELRPKLFVPSRRQSIANNVAFKERRMSFPRRQSVFLSSAPPISRRLSIARRNSIIGRRDSTYLGLNSYAPFGNTSFSQSSSPHSPSHDEDTHSRGSLNPSPRSPSAVTGAFRPRRMSQFRFPPSPSDGLNVRSHHQQSPQKSPTILQPDLPLSAIPDHDEVILEEPVLSRRYRRQQQQEERQRMIEEEKQLEEEKRRFQEFRFGAAPSILVTEDDEHSDIASDQEET